MNQLNINNLTLDLFNVVLVDNLTNSISHVDCVNGFILYDNIPYNVVKEWADNQKLNGVQLNAAFHKSWATVKDSPIELLVTQQIVHYITAALKDANVLDYVYVPLEELDVPNLTGKVTFKIIKGITKEDLITRVLDLLAKPTPLSSETVKNLVSILKHCRYTFTGKEFMANNEAKVYFYEEARVLPENTEDLFRYIFYKATGTTLIINSKEAKQLIKDNNFDLGSLNLTSFDLVRLSSSFNRRKDLWLTIKSTHNNNRSIVNRIAKKSKKHHCPLPELIIKTVTSGNVSITNLKTQVNSTSTTQLISLLNAIEEYKTTNPRAYKIRNGKVWVPKTESTKSIDEGYYKDVYSVVSNELIKRLKCSGKVYLPPNIKYALPKSEKDFVGNIPNGTTIEFDNLTNQTCMVGVHWFNNERGRVDLDLKGFTLEGVVGWDARYSNNSLMYSGDVTDAPRPNGGAEWLYTTLNKEPIVTMITLNKFTGLGDCEFRFLVAHNTDSKINNNYMVDPNNILFSTTMCFKEDESAGISLGLITYNPKEGVLRFTFNNSDINNQQSSRNRELVSLHRRALYNKLTNCVYLNDLLAVSDQVQLVDTIDVDTLDLSLNNLSKTSLLDLFD